MKDDERRDPEAFLDLVPRSQKGRLKIYVGGAAGVGKTYRMLQEAHQLRAQGRDIVAGMIDTHDRAETEALVEDSGDGSASRVQYRGTVLKEMDLDAILARKPESWSSTSWPTPTRPARGTRSATRTSKSCSRTASTSSPRSTSSTSKSLNQLVQRITGVEVKETLPDSFLARADQVVNVDVAVEELRHRLREGKIYPPEQVEQALKNFFKPSNLAALRELALREVARDQSRQREEQDRAGARADGAR